MNYCEDCQYCDKVGKFTRRWLCLKSPRHVEQGYVSKAIKPDPPFWWCNEVNKSGECEMYEETK